MLMRALQERASHVAGSSTIGSGDDGDVAYHVEILLMVLCLEDDDDIVPIGRIMSAVISLKQLSICSVSHPSLRCM